MENQNKPIGWSKWLKDEYTNLPLGNSNPGCFIILVDQTYSMLESYGDGTKADQAAHVVNQAIQNLSILCRRGQNIRDRCYVTVVGYGEQVECIVEGWMSDVYSAFVRLEQVKTQIPDGAGGVVEVEVQDPIWLDPKATGNALMDDAFQHAAEVIERWIPHRPDGFPPVVINITGGAAPRSHLITDKVGKIMSMRTTDGAPLICNFHIPNSEKKVMFPNERSQFSDEPLAQYLFDISSVLPESLFEHAKYGGFSPELGTKCFGYSHDMVFIWDLLCITTWAARPY